MADEQGGKESSWNMAKAYLQRMDFILQKMNQHASDQNYYPWLLECMNLFKEIAPKLTKSDKESHTDMMNGLINIANRIKNNLTGSRKVSINYSPIFPQLIKWDMELRQSMEKLDLISPSKDDPAAAIGGGSS